MVSTKWKRDGDVLTQTSKEDEDSVEKLQRPFLDNCNFFAQMFDDILSVPIRFTYLKSNARSNRSIPSLCCFNDCGK